MARDLSISVKGHNDLVRLTIHSRKDGSYLTEKEDADEFGEAKWQIGEGCTYDYEFLSKDCQFKEIPGFVSRTWTKGNDYSPYGIISPGNYVGTIQLEIQKLTGADWETAGYLPLEIVSTKIDYREDYQTMLEDITKDFSELIMSFSPTSQKFLPDSILSAKTLYQRFAFIKSIVNDSTLYNAVHKIILNPIRQWKQTTESCNIIKSRKLGCKELGQIASSNDRINLPKGAGISLSSEVQLHSLPRVIYTDIKQDTIDTPENRFIKYALKYFLSTVEAFLSFKNADKALKSEAIYVSNKLRNLISASFFKVISTPSILSLNSPALQRRDGYREILKAWVLFNMATKLTWEGGDTVFEAGKKNIAALYEYWVYFKLMDIICSVFNLDSTSKEELVKTDENGINLNLRQGQMVVVKGQSVVKNRRLNICLYYNKVFGNSDIDHEGSWSIEMKPDYTLSIWPGLVNQTDAEKQETITHIHFDAKYRIVSDPKTPDNPSVSDTIFNEAPIDKCYTREDILKMHAYKDAIRRSAGSYILYPGTKNKPYKGYRELLPGIGAFSLCPGKVDEDSRTIKLFILDVVNNLIDRNSERERIAVSNHIIRSSKLDPFTEAFPEEQSNKGSFPGTTPIIISSYRGESTLDWISKNGIFAIPLDFKKKEFHLLDAYLNARYLLLFDKDNLDNRTLLKISSKIPKICSREQLGDNCPLYLSSTYLAYTVSLNNVEEEIKYVAAKNNDTVTSILPHKELFKIVMFSGLFPPKE